MKGLHPSAASFKTVKARYVELRKETNEQSFKTHNSFVLVQQTLSQTLHETDKHVKEALLIRSQPLKVLHSSD